MLGQMAHEHDEKRENKLEIRKRKKPLVYAVCKLMAASLAISLHTVQTNGFFMAISLHTVQTNGQTGGH
jgi:hypothetical protein